MKSRKPTREQRKFLEKHGLDTYKWYVQKDTPEMVQIVNIDSGETKVIQKE